MEVTQVSIHGRMNQRNVVDITMEHHSAIKKRSKSCQGTIDGPLGHYGKGNKLEKTNIVYSNLHAESKNSNSEKQAKDWQLPEARAGTLGK